MNDADQTLQKLRGDVQVVQGLERVMSKMRDMVQELQAIEGLQFDFTWQSARDVALRVSVSPAESVSPSYSRSNAQQSGHGIILADDAPERVVVENCEFTDTPEPAAPPPVAAKPADAKSASQGNASAGEAQEGGDKLVRGPWSDAEVAILMQAMDGGSVAEAARELNRPVTAAYAKAKALRNSENSPADEPQPAKRDAPPKDAPSSGRATPELGASLSADRKARRLYGDCESEVFTVAMDLRLVEGLMAGEKKHVLAAEFKLPENQVTARFRRICPDPTIENQGALLRVLREVAA
ncbi:MAG: hypothetical protein AAFX07_00645 [Pseudomonadota bacterium]